jgi:hypothetical protein
MVYKIKPKKPKELPSDYFENLEVKELQKKYKGKSIPFFEAERVATRRFLSVGNLVHRKNHLVYYKDDLARIEKIEKRGVWIQTYHRDKDDFLTPNKKLTFIPEKRVQHEIYPVTYPQASIGVVAPYNMATMDS